MKVLMLIREYPPYAFGGGGNVAQYLEKYSRELGLELTIIANQPFLKNVSREEKGSTVIYRVPVLGKTFLTRVPSYCFYASRLADKLQDEHDLIYSISSPVMFKPRRPFIAHFQSTRYGEYMACQALGKPIHAFLNKAYIWADRLILERADRVIVLSRGMLEELKHISSRIPDTEVIPNGFDEQLFYPKGPRNFNSLRKNILYVGRLDMRKGIDILLRAAARLSGDFAFRLTIVGEGPLGFRLRESAGRLGLKADFLGKLTYSGLPKVYNEADLVVLPSLYEGMPQVVLEAMACGSPVITSLACPDVGAPRFKTGDVDSLTQSLRYYLSSSDRLEDLSRKVLDKSRDFHWEKITRRLIDCFKLAVGNG